MQAGMNLTMRATEFFLDRAEIQERVGKYRARALRVAGSFVRRKARTRVLRRRKRSSPPGSPPSVHAKDPTATLKNILYAYDPVTQSVPVGPIKLNQVVGVPGGAKTVPQLLTEGGTAEIEEEARADGRPWSAKTGRWRRRDRRYGPKPWKVYRRRQARYAPRPIMSVALRDALPEIPTAFQGFLFGGDKREAA